MNNLWAPWRGEYINAKKDGACFLCDAPQKRSYEELKTELVLFKGAVTSVIMNKFPYNSGHLLISPVRHIAKIEELTPEESIDLFRILRHTTAAITMAFNPEGFNIGINLGRAAGAGIEEHMHMHVVPRWNGDSNFMPLLTEVKVIPEHLQETFEKLKPFFERI